MSLFWRVNINTLIIDTLPHLYSFCHHLWISKHYNICLTGTTNNVSLRFITCHATTSHMYLQMLYYRKHCTFMWWVSTRFISQFRQTQFHMLRHFNWKFLSSKTGKSSKMNCNSVMNHIMLKLYFILKLFLF